MHTKDIGEVMQLQSDFLRNQFGVATDQFKKMTGEAACKDTSKKTPTWFRAPDRPNELAYGQSTSIEVARHVSVAAGLLIGFAEGQVILAWHWPLIWKVWWMAHSWLRWGRCGSLWFPAHVDREKYKLCCWQQPIDAR
jgi:hypothetical protein